MKNTQSRKWQLTINNPEEKNINHESIKTILEEMKVEYWCMSDEVGEEGTPHIHVFFYRSGSIKFNRIKDLFPKSHIEMARGTVIENREYVFKEGKWINDKKHETNKKESHEEYGEIPIERPGTRNDIQDLYDMIKEGKSNAEIIEENPQYIFRITGIEQARQALIEEEHKKVWRTLQVEYIYGETGTGKTRSVMEQYGYDKVFRITDYLHPWDNYKGQDVIVFEEFRSSLKIQDMLNYLDGYPLELPCRYSNKIACYTKVYIITNIHLSEQYETIQTEHRETWSAFLRRINKVIKYKKDGTKEEGIIKGDLIPIDPEKPIEQQFRYPTTK